MQKMWYTFLIILCCGCILPKQATAQNGLPFFLTNNNTGKDFYFSFPPAYSQGFGGTNIKIYIASTVETNVSVNVEANSWVGNVKTIPNGVVEVVIPPAIAQPYFKQMNGPSAADQIYRQKAIHITADDPVMVYGATIFQSSSDAFLVLPTSSLGTEYIVSSYSEAQYSDNNFYFWPSQALVVAPFDGTEVTFTLGGNVGTKTNGAGKGANGLTPGQSKKFSMNKGDVLNISSYGIGSDLSGSKVTANQPIGVVTGVFCANIPSTVSGFTWCDYIGEQEMPSHVWGKAYPVTKIFGRQKNSYIRIVAKEPDTQVFRNGQKIGTLQTAGGTIGKGFMDMRISEGEQGSFIITADKPINVNQYNPSGIDDNMQSEPFQMAMLPMEQGQKDYLFSTPSTPSAKDFTSHYLNVVFELDAQKNLPDNLEIASVESGKLKWVKVVEQYGSTFEEINYDMNGKRFGVKIIKLPRAGVYGLRAAAPVYAYLYNPGNDPYGCPASALMADQTVVDLEAPVPVFTQKEFGEVSGARIIDFPEAAAKRSNLASVYMITQESFNYKLTVGKLIPGQSRDVTWGLTVIDPTQPAKAVVAFIDRAGNDTTVTVEFEGVKTAAVELINYDFGAVTLGNSKEGKVRITSTGTKDVVVTAIEVPSSAAFIAETPAVPFTITPGSYEEISVRFEPRSMGAASGNIVFRMNDLSAAAATVTGSGSKPGLTATSVNFANVEVGSSSNKTIKLSNTGTETVRIMTLRTPTVSAFTIPEPDMPELPLVIEPGRSYDLPVHFEPSDTGSYSDEILMGIYTFEVAATVSGRGTKTPSVGVGDDIAQVLAMSDIYPNPAGEEAVVGYTLPGTGHVRLSLFNTMGQELLSLADGVQPAGDHTIRINTGALSPGMYYCRLMYGGHTIVGTVVVR